METVTPGGRRRRRGAAAVAVAVALAVGAAGRPAAAQAPGPAPAPAAAAAPAPAAAPAAAEALTLVVSGDGAELDPAALRAAIEAEVGGRVVLGGGPPPIASPGAGLLTVAVHRTRAELEVGYTSERRGTIVRVVEAPAAPADLIRNAAWLAGNLVRDEAGELLGPEVVPAVVPPPLPPPPARSAPAAAVTTTTTTTTTTTATVVAPRPARPFEVATASLFFPVATNRTNPHVRTWLNLNLVYGRVGVIEGLQLGFANQVDERVRGAQLALLFNTVGGDVEGIQASFVANSAVDVHGLQLGLVNVARKVRGVQLGLINVAEEIDGVPIGLVSVSKDGGVHPVVWSSGDARINVGVKFSTRYTYTQFSASTTVESSIRMSGPGFALGFRVPIVAPFTFETDLFAAYLFGGPLSGVSRMQGLQDDMALDSLRARITLQIYRHLSAFAGGALTAKTRFYQEPGSAVTVNMAPELFAGVEL
jgi:hypothetical protein